MEMLFFLYFFFLKLYNHFLTQPLIGDQMIVTQEQLKDIMK